MWEMPIRSSNRAPSQRGCVVNGQMTEESNKYVLPPPPPAPLPSPFMPGQGGVTEVAASAAATVTTSTESATEEPKTAPSAGIEAAAPAPVGGEGEGEGKGLEVEKEVVVEVKAEAAVEVVAEEKEKEEEAPIVVESRTVQLSKRVGEEAAMATSRSRRMSDLSSELKRWVVGMYQVARRSDRNIVVVFSFSRRWEGGGTGGGRHRAYIFIFSVTFVLDGILLLVGSAILIKEK